MANTIKLSDLDEHLQRKLVNTVNSPLDQTTRVLGINTIIQFLQSECNWDTTKRLITFDYLKDESDYSVEDDLSISDLKDIKTIRDPNNAYERFDNCDENLIDEYVRENRVVNAFSVEERDNKNILRMIYRNGNTKTTISTLDDTDSGGGTWSSDTTDSDATTLSNDTDRKKEGSGSLAFNIDVSQSANDKAMIYNDDLTDLDLSDYENIGYFRAWLDLQQMTSAQLGYITNVELRIGSDSSNYWAMTTTAPITYGSFQKGWNKLSWQWKNATETGTPDSSAIDYVALIINYSSSMTDVSNIRFDDLVAILPREMEMVYFSDYMVMSSAGVWQLEFTTSAVDTTEELLLPTRHRDAFLSLVAEYLFRQMKENSDQSYVYEQLRGNKGYKAMKADIGNEIIKDVPSILINSNACERTEGHLMWS